VNSRPSAERQERLRGIGLMIVAVAIFAVMDALLKHLATRYPPMQVACLRGASSLPFVFLSYAATRRLAELRPRSIPMHLARGVLSVAMLWCFVWALARMSMANTYAITLSAPLLVVPFAALFLREKTDAHGWAAILAGLAGVLVILNPTASGFVGVAGLAAFATAVCWAVVVVMLRVMAASETTAAMVFWFLLLTALGAGALAASAWIGIDARDWIWIALLGLTGWVAQHLITEAFRLAPASTVAPFEYMSIVWGACIDWVVWRTVPGARMFAGAGVVVAAGLYLMYRERSRFTVLPPEPL
jgi:drug/metabolite transporter (DMT)-like permease